MNRPVRVAAALLLALGTLLTACQAAAPAPTSVTTPAPITLKVLMLSFLSYAPLQIAQAEGFFAEQGLQIEFVNIQNVDEVVALLAQGKLDVAAGAMRVSMLNAMAEGYNIRFVADKGWIDPRGCPYTAVMARRELVESGALNEPAQAKGLRVDVNKVFVEGYWFEKWLAGGQLSLDDVQLVDIAPAAEMEALNRNQVDLTVMSEPSVTRMVKANAGVLYLPVQNIMPGAQFAFILYGPTLLEKNRDAGNRFMVAYLRGVRQYNEGKTDRNLDIVAKASGNDRQLLKDSCWISIHSDGSVTLETVLDYQSWAVGKGYANGGVTEANCWDGSFIEYANRVLGAAKP